ncbi:hypothetical protein TWF225_011380 [Orbilia oligospora]|nr:hypothetical protein TWF225_011380 [Orbilia oligospora]KAF3181327.1 hypothetical protein TWF751_009276 [Orbilia oligospora]KAF3247845.1 hypothetical protein TWF128_008561 [Orbilia oligospora]
MAFVQKVTGFFARSSEKKKKKEKREDQHVYGRHMLVVPPITTAMVFAQLPPGEPMKANLPKPPPKAHIREHKSYAAGPCRSLPAYTQEGLAAIDLIPRPAWETSLSLNKLEEEQSQINRHFRYAFWDKKGIKSPTIAVGPVRMRALKECEDIMERAEKESLPVDIDTEGANYESEPTGVAILPSTKDEEWLGKIEGKSLVNRITRAFKIGKVMKLVGTGRRGVGQKVKPLPEPVENPLSLGFRRWLREGVDPAANPQTSSPRLYGRDRKGPKRTVFPREWNTTLVTKAERPCAVPAEGYGSTAAEYATFQQWLEVRGEELEDGGTSFESASFYEAQGISPPPHHLCSFVPVENWKSVAPFVW